MNKIQALKDPEFRNALSASEQAGLDHPVGVQEVEDSVLNSVTGGCNPGCGGGGTGPSTRLWSCVPPGQGCP